MITRDILQEIIKEQREVFLRKRTVERELSIPEKSSRIQIVSGVRRCGKSTFIKKSFLGEKNVIYLNFEDPRLTSFEQSDFFRIEELLPDKARGRIMLDEIQNIDAWETYARSAHERGISLILTGSNASLLSRELGTKLTGRYDQLELFPFSYPEYLQFFQLEKTPDSFSEYFRLGGFPEYLEEQNSNYHRLLFRDIIMRDIVVRRHLQNEKQLMRLAIHLISNIGKPVSFNNLAKTLEIKSVRTVIDYCDYLEDSYVVELIPVFSHSPKKQAINPKKAYAIDTAFAQSNSISFSEDLGRRLENLAYLHLRRSTKQLFYFQDDGKECDFLVKDKEKITTAIQVCWKVDRENIEREVNGLKHALAITGAEEGVIVTSDQEDEIEGVRLVPFRNWVWE